MTNVIKVDFGARRRVSNGNQAVSITWSIDRTIFNVWLIDPLDPTADEEVGSFLDHAAAAAAGMGVAVSRGVLLVDHTAMTVPADVWHYRPFPAAVHVHKAPAGFTVSVEPACRSWVALDPGCYNSLDVAGDRAVELCQMLRLPIVDHVHVLPPSPAA